MKLLERYVNAVGEHLPKEQRQDVVRELRENLVAQIEDREEALGRALTEPEIEALLSSHGHPVRVAGRYRPDLGRLVVGRAELIGPELFPLYLRVLGISLLCTTIARAGFAIVAGHAPWTRFSGAIGSLLTQAAIVTVIFVIADRHFAKHPLSWTDRPRDPLKPAGRPGLAFEFIALVAMTAWWVALPFLTRDWFEPASAVMSPGLAWTRCYIGVLLLTVLQIPVAAIALVWPRAVRFRAGAMTVIHLLTAALGFSLLGLGSWVVAVDPEAARLVRMVNSAGTWGALLFGVIGLLNAGREIWRLARPPRAAALPLGVA